MKKAKRIAACIMSMVICGSIANLKVGAIGTYVTGDVNGDGSVTSVDTAYIANVLNGIKKTSGDLMTQRMDVTSDGVIDYADLNIISSISVGDYGSPTYKNYYNTSGLLYGSSLNTYKIFNAQTGAQIGNDYTLYALSSVPDYASTQNIIGEDTRDEEANVKGEVELNCVINGQNVTGTGFVVGSHTILTSAENLYRNYSKATNLNYTIYNTHGSAIGTYSAQSYHLASQVVGSGSIETRYNYALITVAQDLSSQVMKVGLSTKKLNDTMPDIYVTGYNVSCGDNIDNRIVSDFGQLVNGKVGNTSIQYDTDMADSQSGSPVYVKNYYHRNTVIGIALSRDNNSSSYNEGVRISSDILHFIYNNPNI